MLRYCSYFTDGETEAQKMRYPRSQANRAELSVNQEAWVQSQCSSPAPLRMPVVSHVGTSLPPWHPHGYAILLYGFTTGYLAVFKGADQELNADQATGTSTLTPGLPSEMQERQAQNGDPGRAMPSGCLAIVRKDQIYQHEVYYE